MQYINFHINFQPTGYLSKMLCLLFNLKMAAILNYLTLANIHKTPDMTWRICMIYIQIICEDLGA